MADGLVRDEFGVVWRRDAGDRNIGDWGELHAVLLARPTLEGYRFPDGSVPVPADATARVSAPDEALFSAAYRVFPTALGLRHAAANARSSASHSG